MRDRIELGKRQVQQSQWGSKYALNGDDSYEHTVGECPTIPTMRDMYGYQSSYTSSWNNYPNLATQPQPQSSMSTSSLEQAILKISKVMEDFVGEQQKINSHLNEKIDNLESSMNDRKVQDSIEKLTNLDIARGERKLPPQPHHNLQGTNAKRSRKVLKIDTLVGDCYDNSMDQPSIENHKVQDDKGLLEPFKASTSLGKRREMNSLDHMGRMPILFGIQGIQHEVRGNARMMKEKEEKREFWPLVLLPLWGIFGVLPRVYFIHTIYRFKLGSQESNAQTVPKSELKRKVMVIARKLHRADREFRTPLFKVRKFSHRANHLLAHECHFAHPKPIFAPCETGAKISHTTIQGAKFIPRCEILILRCENFAPVGHDFGALPGTQIMHMICRFKA
ncbi:hypothetical protein AAG906_026671 [Vitis piasezkii]